MSDIGRLVQQRQRPLQVSGGNAKLSKKDGIVCLRREFTRGELAISPPGENRLRTEQGGLQQGVRVSGIRSHFTCQDGDGFGRPARSYECIGETPACKDVMGAEAEELLVL